MCSNGAGESSGKDSNRDPRIRRGQLLKSVADRNVYQIVHLIYRSKSYELNQRLRVLPHQHDRALERRLQRRDPHVAPSGSAAAPGDQAGVATFDAAVDGASERGALHIDWIIRSTA